MTPSTFEGLRGLIHSESGIALRAGKEALVTARLAKRLRTLALDDERQYLDLVRGDASGRELERLLDAISTNVTSFFREADHFGTIIDHLRVRAGDGARRLRLWSAGCATGEEPYSLAMAILDELGVAGVDLRILATDLSTTALARARAGRYSAQEVHGLGADTLGRHFRRDVAGGGWHVTSRVAACVAFEPLNLANAPYPMPGPLDAVLCRNVMIYFSAEAKQRVVGEVTRLLRPGGLFVIGHSETLHGVETELRLVRPSVYQKPSEA